MHCKLYLGADASLEVAQIQRTYALYGRSKWIIMSTVSVGLAVIALSIVRVYRRVSIRHLTMYNCAVVHYWPSTKRHGDRRM